MAKSEELQRQTQRVLAELGAPGKMLSARAAGERLDVGYNQIADMLKGKTPAEKTLIRFADAIGEPPTDWLRYAGKIDAAKTSSGGSEDKEAEEQRFARQIAKELADVPKEMRPLLVRQIRALIRATAAGSGK